MFVPAAVKRLLCPWMGESACVYEAGSDQCLLQWIKVKELANDGPNEAPSLLQDCESPHEHVASTCLLSSNPSSQIIGDRLHPVLCFD